MKKLIAELCKREGKKVQVSVGNMREILSKLADIMMDPNQSEAAEDYLKYMSLKRAKATGVEVYVNMMVEHGVKLPANHPLVKPAKPAPKKKKAKKKVSKK